MGHINTELHENVLRICIDRPEKKNALTVAMYTAMAEAVEHGEANPEVRVMLLHGNGDSFTAGNDLQDFMANPWKGQDVPPAVRFMLAVAHAKKPVIVAIQGSTVGIGVTILLHCDLVYAADDAKLVMPFVNLGHHSRGWFDAAGAGADGTSAGGGVADAGDSDHGTASV